MRKKKNFIKMITQNLENKLPKIKIQFYLLFFLTKSKIKSNFIKNFLKKVCKMKMFC